MNEVKRHLVSRGCIVNDQTLPVSSLTCSVLQVTAVFWCRLQTFRNFDEHIALVY